MEKLKSILFSTRIMAILFLTYAIAMAVGTLIESKYNTATAKIWVYNAWWFEAILLFFMINFIGNIKRYQLLKKEKWATLLLHLSFILIIFGAFITRYISYEGAMPIREADRLIRTGKLAEVLEFNDRAVLRESLGLSKADCTALKQVWTRMRERRRSRRKS